LGSEGEFRYWFRAYVTSLAQRFDGTRLQAVCDRLLGTRGQEVSGEEQEERHLQENPGAGRLAWWRPSQKHIVGKIEKHQLLRDVVLPIMSRSSDSTIMRLFNQYTATLK